jgi:hypothetical protein
MALIGVSLETPALVAVGMPILTAAEYQVEREINAAGSWALAFPCAEQLANQVKGRWRVSIVEEGRPGYLLRRGIVTVRNYQVAEDGSGVLVLQGHSRLYGLGPGTSTHQGLAFDGVSADIEDISDELSGESVTAPASASSRKPKVTFNDTSKLAAWLTACELARYNLRETFNEDSFELVEQDDVPDSGYSFILAEEAGDYDTAAARGLGLIAGAPTIGHSSEDTATRIIPVGVDWDGKPLTLQYSTKSTPYAIQVGVNPDGSNYYYLQDAAAEADGEVLELPYVRSDVKNPSDNAGTREAAANVLYALAAGELIKRRSDVISFGCAIANGDKVDALPGSRVRVRFRGNARTPWGTVTWEDLDRDFLVAKRRDASSVAGVRQVSFTLTAPEVQLYVADLPEAVPIPAPPSEPPDPPPPPDPNDPNDPFDPSLPPEDPALPETPLPPDLPPELPSGAYQPCCDDPRARIGDGAEDPPDITTEPPLPPTSSITAENWSIGDAIPPDAVIWLYVNTVWVDPPDFEDSHSLSGSDVVITLLEDYQTGVARVFGPLQHVRVHHYLYKVKVAGPSPNLSLTGGFNTTSQGWVFYGTPTVDISSFTHDIASFVKVQSGLSLTITQSGDEAALFFGADWAVAASIAGNSGSVYHNPFDDDGWIEGAFGRGSGHKPGGGTATFTWDADYGPGISPTDNSEVSMLAVAVTA